MINITEFTGVLVLMCEWYLTSRNRTPLLVWTVKQLEKSTWYFKGYLLAFMS